MQASGASIPRTASSRRARAVLWLALALPVGPKPALAAERVVALVPMGTPDKALVELAVREVEARVDVEVRVDPPRELPRKAWYKPRSRWRAEKILEAVDADPPTGAWKAIVLTDAEISTTKGAIVDWRIGGLGTIGGPSCVVSTWIHVRSSKTKAVLERRMTDLVVHELGHTLGCDHCETDRCVMRDAKGKLLETADSSSMQFCPKCRAKVGEDALK